MSKSQAWADLIGRTLLAAIFILAGLQKAFNWNQTEALMSARGIPYAHVALGAAATIELLGGLGILLGRFTRLSAVLLFLYLIPVTISFHAFWAASGPMAMDQFAHFLKNLGLMGAFLTLASHGPGRFSIDSVVFHARARERLESARRLRAA
jgi:putative oxidoreductase